jgi:hypothetical protein
MWEASRTSFEGDNALDDEIDQLFSHLEQFEPPDDFVDRVMAEVSRLAPHQFMPTSSVDDECGGMRHFRHRTPAS